MDATKPSHTPMRPKNMAELLPEIKALLSKDTVHLLTSKKQPPSKICQTRTNEKNKNIKPMTLAEIRALIGPTPKKYQQPTTSTKTKPWNSSVKVDKAKSLTKDGQMKHSTVRKELNFQLKPKPAANNRATMTTTVARKSIYPQVKVNDHGITRISGVCKIPETPVIKNSKHTFILPHQVAPIKMNNISFKSNSDDSFVQREKEINDFEKISNALTEEPSFEKIEDISPPVSTPFKDYRNIRDYFSHSETDTSVLWNDNTIMSFEKPVEVNDNKRDESVIVSLCEMLNKATVANSNNKNQELGDLMEVERQTENTLKMIDNVIEMLNSVKEKQLKSLKHLKKLKHEIFQTNGAKQNNLTLVPKENNSTNIPKVDTATVKENIATSETENSDDKTIIKIEKVSPEKSPISSRPTVIKSKSPSYKIPRKSICLRKKVFCKSMPNVSDAVQTPNKYNSRALSMYMQMKEQMTFLNTPLGKPRAEIPDTPAITSRNLQKQLDKLYN